MQEITLTQNTFKLFPTVYAVQNDTGRELKMIIQDQTLLLGDTGAVAVQRSDGSYYTIAATLNVLDNAFTADISQALTQPGRTLCQLKVTRSGLVVSSYTFAIMVQPSTDGVPAEQLGISAQELMAAAAQLTLSDNDVKLALLQIAEKVAYIDQDGQDYYDALEAALYPPIRATGVTLDKNSLVFSGIGGTETLTATISPNNVEDPTVYWGSSDKDVAVVSDGIVTAVGNGSCTITATCGTKHANASVSVASATLVSVSASYVQTGTIYDNDDLSAILTAGVLIVSATWSNGLTTIVSNDDVTLSGSLAIGTSTITAEYGGKTDTFTVTVTEYEQWSYDLSDLQIVVGACATENSATCKMGCYGAADAARRSFIMTTGDQEMALRTNGVWGNTSGYYPIKVPKTATHAVVTITPSTQYVQCLTRSLTGGVYSAYDTQGKSGYVQGGLTRDFEAASNIYMFISSKYNNAGTTYPVEPTQLSVVFS